MMKNIYSEAVAVLAWLGPEADSSGEVMDEIAKAGSILVSQLSITPYPEGVEARMTAAMEAGWHKLVLLMLGWIDFLTDPNRTGRQQPPTFWEELGWEKPERRLPLEAWAAFWSRPYWSLVWILQELAISRDAYILCGARKEHLYSVLAILTFMPAISRIPFDSPVIEWIYEF